MGRGKLYVESAIGRSVIADHPIGDRPIPASRYAVSFDATIVVPSLSKATPTSPGPASTSSGAAPGRHRYSPLDPASASTTNSVPWRSKASPCGRPNPEYVVVTVPWESMRYNESYDASVGPVT